MAIDFTQTHPDFDATASARAMSRDFYEGTAAVRAKGSTYLIKETNESDDDYATRLSRAVVDNYVEKIVVERQAYIWKREPTRELPKNLEAVADNVDLHGADASTFFRQATREAQIDGISWVAVDAPPVPDGGYKSLFEERSAGHRFFFELLPGDAVVDWSAGTDKGLLYAVIAQNIVKPRQNPGEEAETVTHYKLWRRDAWELYEEADGEPELINSGPNPLGMVPLIPFLGRKRTPYSGWPVARPVLHHIALIYNKSSDLDWYERLSAHPIPVVVGPDNPEKLNWGSGVYLPDDGGTTRPPSLELLETTGSAHSTQRASIKDLEERIWSIALAQSKRETHQVQSADTLREDRSVFTASLRAAAGEFEKSEQACWRLAARFTGANEAETGIHYNRDYDDLVVTPQMIQTLNSLAESSRITDKTLLQRLQEGGVLPEGFDIEEELAELQRTRAKAAAISLEAFRRPEPEEEEDEQDEDAIAVR